MAAGGDDEPITNFLARLNLHKYTQKMHDEDIDMVGTLRMLNEEDLKELGVGLGGRRIIAAALSS